MIPNLSQLTYHKRNLTPKDLGHGEAPIPRHQILAALIVDLFVVASASNLLSSLFGVSFRSFFSTPSLQKIWTQISFNSVNLITLAIVSVSYFSLCYFFNEGQSAGARFLGLRLKMKHHDARAAFKEALRTLGVYLSFGLSAPEFSKRMVRHDYQYQQFLSFREMRAPNLVSAIEEYHAHESSYEQEAA